MYRKRKEREVHRIAKSYVQRKLEEKTFPSIGTKTNKKLSIIYQVCRLSFAIIVLSLCVLQCWEQVFFFTQKPIKVRADITEEIEGDFPAIHLASDITDETNDHDSKLRGKIMATCEHALKFFIDNHTDLYEVIERTNFTKMIQSISFVRGSKHYPNKFGTRGIYSLRSISTRIENVERIQLGSHYRLKIQLQTKIKFSPKFRGHFFLWIVVTAKAKNPHVVIVSPLHFGNFLVSNVVAFTFKRYKFINRKSSACVEKTEMEHCESQCYFNAISVRNFTCQLPFLPQKEKSHCIANKEACNYLEEINDITTITNPHFDCHCPTECEKTMVTSHYFSSESTDLTAEFYCFSNWIRTLTEYFFYDFIALMCDLGGCFCFYTGLCCLSIVDIITRTFRQQKRRLRLYFKKKSQFEIMVINKVQNILTHQQKKQQIHLRFNIKFKKVFVLIMCAFCSYLIYEQIVAFKAYATYETIELLQEKQIQIPSMVVCTEPDEIYQEKEVVKINKQLNATCAEDIDILELLDEPSKFAGDVELLWEESADMYKYEAGEDIFRSFAARSSIVNPKFMEKSEISTLFGECVHLKSASLKYTPKDIGIYLIYLTNGLKCNSHTKLFLMQTPDRMNIKPFALQPHSSWMIVRFFKQTIQRQDSPIKPCVNLTKFDQCEMECLKKKLSKENIKCRLPFMNSSSLPLCNTSASAKSVRRSYINIYSNVICNCYHPCTETVFTSVNEYAMTRENNVLAIGTKFFFESNINEIFKQQFVKPVTKCISDIGSILGFFLGISVLSLFQLLQNVYLSTNQQN